MSDPSLSLLSRGCGRFVSASRDSYGFDGRLEVCFTPQDYFIWRSHDSLLRLSKSGHMVTEAESALPKTFSTRRGPLLLYSQDLVTVEAGCGPDTRRRTHVVQENREEVEEQLSTLKELTAAILNYGSNQFIFSRLGPPFFPSLHLSYDPHQTGSSPRFTTPEPSEPDLHEQLSSWWGSGPGPACRNRSCLEDKPEDPQTDFSAEEEEDGSRKRVRLDLFLQIPSRTPTPQGEPQPWVHYVAVTPEDPAERQRNSDLIAPRRPGGSETNPAGTREELLHLSRGRRVELRESGPEPQTDSASGVNLSDRRSGCDGAFREKTTRAQLLPPIAESRTGTPSRTPRLHQQPLTLPQLLPERLKKSGAGGETTQRQNLKREGGGGGGGGGAGGGGGGGRRLPSEKGLISLDPGGGVLGCVSGRKGPGKQSSSAFLQNQILNLKDPREPGSEERGVIRGVLPLELRDLQSDKPVGCLIVGPDGEILRVSVGAGGEDDTRERALQVSSPEGEKLPWIIMLQPEHTHTDGELDSDVPAEEPRLHQSTHEDLHRWSDASSPRCSSTDSESRKQTPSEEGEEGWKSERKEAQKNVRMPPLKETMWREEQRGGDAEAEEEEEERLGDAGQIRHLKGPTGTGERSRNQSEAATEETSDRKRRNMKREDPEEAAKTKREKGAESEGQKTRRDGRSLKEKMKSDAQPIRSQKKEERSERDAAETQDGSAEVKKKVREQEGKEEREGRGGDVVRRKQGSAGRRSRRRRGELTHTEMVLEDSEEQEETKDQPHFKSPGSPEPTDRLLTSSDKLSSVQSVSSLRSTAAASNLRSSRRSVASSCEGAGPASAVGLTSSHGRLSSCSTVMVTEEQLMLNPVKPESFRPGPSQEEEQEEEALRLAQRAERRRQEVERKRREREEEERRQQEREQTEDKMKSELEEERRRRAEEIRSRREAEEEKRRKQEEEEQDRARREQEQRDRERRRQEEKKRQMERLQRMREEEERRRRAEEERLRLEEERRREEENRKLQEMDESERTEYLERKEQEEEEKRRREEEAARQAAEEAGLQAELLDRQMALLQQQLAFKQGLVLEAAGLKESQRISRPWIYSYFTLLKILGPNPDTSGTKTSDL